MSEMLTALQDVDPICSFGLSTVCRWVQRFKSGRSELLLKHNPGRARSATDEINTEMRMISAGFLPHIGFYKDRQLIKNIMSTFGDTFYV